MIVIEGVDFMSVRDLTYIALFTALLAVSSILVIPLWPVPVTLQVFFFLLIPALLGPLKGSLAILLYIALGLLGLPVLAGGTGGFQSIFSPSFGFLIGGLIQAIYLGKKLSDPLDFKGVLLHMVVAIFILYLFGVTHQYFIMNRVMMVEIPFGAVIVTNILTFFPIDLLKAFLATALYLRLRSLDYFKNQA